MSTSAVSKAFVRGELNGERFHKKGGAGKEKKQAVKSPNVIEAARDLSASKGKKVIYASNLVRIFIIFQFKTIPIDNIRHETKYE